MAVVEGFFRRAEEGGVNGAGGERGGEREVAAGEAFREAEKIRDYVFLLAGEHFAGAAEAGHDLVEDEVGAGFIAPFPQGGEHAGGPGTHLVDALDQRLDDDGGDALGGGQLIERADVPDGEAHAAHALGEAAATERGRAEGVAMVAV